MGWTEIAFGVIGQVSDKPTAPALSSCRCALDGPQTPAGFVSARGRARTSQPLPPASRHRKRAAASARPLPTSTQGSFHLIDNAAEFIPLMVLQCPSFGVQYPSQGRKGHAE